MIVDDLRVEDLLDLVADRVVDRLRLELARDRVLHAVDQRQLGVPLPRLVHQPRVLERHAQAARERLQQLLVGLAEGVLAVDVLERDHAVALPPTTSGTNRTDFGASPATITGCRTARASAVDVLVDQQRLARLEHVLAEADRRASARPCSRSPRSIDVREVRQARRLVVDGDVDDLGVEDLPDPVADGVVDRLQLELAGDGVLDAVDQRQLGVPLPRLVHEPRVLERHAQAARERLQELLVGLAERVLAVDVLERDHARRLAAGDERDEEHRLRCRSAGDVGLPYRSASAVDVLVDQQRLARLEHVLREAGRRRRLRHAAARRARSMYGNCMSPVASSSVAIVDDLRVEDLLDPVADGVVDRLRVELARDRVLHAVDQRQLGVPLPRLVHEPRVLERDAEAAGERRQQADVVLGERVRPVEVLERDPPANSSAGDQRGEEHGQRRLALHDGHRLAPLAARGQVRR